MRVPFDWLKEFTPVSAAAGRGRTAHHERSRSGGTGADITPVHRVYVGRILEIEAIPAAEKLSLCRVEVGADVLPIVCGAPNVAKGRKVAVALPGGRLADNSVIEKKRLVGVESSGMLCSEKELGLSDDHSGIFVLPDGLRTGEPLEAALGIADYVLDVNVPPKQGRLPVRPGHREGSGGIYGLSVTLPSFTLNETDAIDGLIELIGCRHGRLPQVCAAHGGESRSSPPLSG